MQHPRQRPEQVSSECPQTAIHNDQHDQHTTGTANVIAREDRANASTGTCAATTIETTWHSPLNGVPVPTVETDRNVGSAIDQAQ